MTESIAIFKLASLWQRIRNAFVRRRSAVNDRIESAEAKLLNLPQIDMPLIHRFAPKVYLREIFMPAGTMVIAHEHRTEHFNIVLTGRAKVSMNGVMEEIVAPCIFISKPGVRKVLYITEDMRWATVHPTNKTSVEKLERQLIVKSGSFLDHAKEMEQFKQQIAEGKTP